MTDPDQAAPVDLDATRLALDVAVAQLVQPSTEKIARADGMLDDHIAAQRADERAVDAELAARHAGYLRARQHAQARRTLEQLSDHRRRVAAGRGSEAVTATSAVVPSLLDQLLDAVAGSSGTDDGASAARSRRSAIALGAAHIKADIERTVRWGRTATGDQDPHPDVRVQLPRWAARAPTWQQEAPLYLAQAAAKADEWVADIRALLNPGQRTTIIEPCPECRRTTAHAVDDTGETVRRAALEVDLTHRTARCWGCHTTWPPEFLARLLDQQRAERKAREETA